MATRYVYEKWSSVKEYSLNKSFIKSIGENTYYQFGVNKNHSIATSGSYSFDHTTGSISLNGNGSYYPGPGLGTSFNSKGESYLNHTGETSAIYAFILVNEGINNPDGSIGYTTDEHPTEWSVRIKNLPTGFRTANIYKYTKGSYSYIKGTTKYSGYVTSSASSISATSSYFYDRIGSIILTQKVFL